MTIPEEVRKPLTYLSIACIAAAISLGWDRVKGGDTFRSDFGAGKDLTTLTAQGQNAALVYKVEPGDAWWKIARDHGVTTRALLQANGAIVGTPLVPGQNIKLPAPDPAPSASTTPR